VLASMNGVTPGVVAALDVGGTTIKGAVVAADGTLSAERRWPTPLRAGPDVVISAVTMAAREIVDLARETDSALPVALGIASLGLVDTETGTAVRSSTVGWSNVPLAKLAAADVDLPVVLVHDIAAAATAEATLLAAPARANFLFVGIGTGIGGAMVLNGEPVRGAHQRAGEIGHIRVRGSAQGCGCGQTGCLETIASGRAIAGSYQARTHRHPAETAARVAAAAANGDPVATEVWSRACEALAEALATYSILMDPALIVLGGGLSLAGENLLGPVRDGLAARITLPGLPELIAARWGDRGALIGAALAARRLGSAASCAS